MPPKYREIDHTADAGLRIYGKTRANLFINAAEGLFHIIGSGSLLSGDSSGPTVTKTISLKSTDEEMLLKDWLSELHYIHSSEYVYFTEFEIHKIDASSIEGEVRGFKFDPSADLRFQEIKAVTYHGLEIIQTKKGFEAQVIFDI